MYISEYPQIRHRTVANVGTLCCQMSPRKMMYDVRCSLQKFKHFTVQIPSMIPVTMSLVTSSSSLTAL